MRPDRADQKSMPGEPETENTFMSVKDTGRGTKAMAFAERCACGGEWFSGLAQRTSRLMGSSGAFLGACCVTAIWLCTGPLFGFSDTWQLVINSVANITCMLMVFVIHNTQNRESTALQLKLDELLRAVHSAQNSFINLEELTESDLEILKVRYAALAEEARKRSGFEPEP